MNTILNEVQSKEILLSNAHKQLQDIRKAVVDMKKALKTNEDAQLKFMVTVIDLVHTYLFEKCGEMAINKVLERRYRH